jgi:trehalose 6-phosphate synthase
VSRRPAPLILVSNRGPVAFSHGPDGDLQQVRGGGGLVTALLGLVEHTPALWVSAAISEGDAAMEARAGGGSFPIDHFGLDTRLRFVSIDHDTYHSYYNVVANPMLWFIQHYLWDLSNAPDVRHEELEAWEHGYLAANRAFADAVVEELDEDPNRVVMLHDYHLYTAPESIRAAHPDAFLHHFVHIPWSQPDYWRILPSHIREGILKGLLANDIIAFHTRAYSRNFLLCCEDLLDLEVDYDRR